MKKTLYKHDDILTSVEITAAFEGGELLIQVNDMGNESAGLWSHVDDEYAIILPEPSVSELRHVLNLYPTARRELLETLADRFNSYDCFEELEEFLYRQRIKFKYYNWSYERLNRKIA